VDAANSLALSTSVLACELIDISHCLAASLSHTLCICVDSVAGLSLPDKSNQAASASGIDKSSNSFTGADRMDCWRSRVDAEDAKKAEGASICALLMPSPPCRTGSEAWSHCDSVRSTFKTEESPRLRVLSNIVRSGLSQQLDVRRKYRSFGILRLFLSKTKASWE